MNTFAIKRNPHTSVHVHSKILRWFQKSISIDKQGWLQGKQDERGLQDTITEGD